MAMNYKHLESAYHILWQCPHTVQYNYECIRMYYNTYTYVNYTHVALAKLCSKAIEIRSMYSNRTVS